MKCRGCEGKNLTKVLDLGNMPLAGAFLKQEDFATEKFYPLELYFCQDCYLVQVGEVPSQQDEVFKHTCFRSGTSGAVRKHFEEFAQELKGCKKVLEIGSNDGTFLKAMERLGIFTIGVDPLVHECFSEQVAQKVKEAHGQVDAIVSSYTLSHIDDLQDVMRGVKLLLKDDGVFIFETYYLDDIIMKLQYDAIYHEHCCYFSVRSAISLLGRFDMLIDNIEFIPGFRSGCIRFYARNGVKDADSCYCVVDTLEDFSKGVEAQRNNLLSLLYKVKAEGKTIIGYGATGRATIMMNYCGIDQSLLDYVVDDTPEKQGLYMPGTHVPIKAWQDGTDYVLIFAWAFADEIMEKHKDFHEAGGKWIIPLPEVRVV